VIIAGWIDNESVVCMYISALASMCIHLDFFDLIYIPGFVNCMMSRSEAICNIAPGTTKSIVVILWTGRKVEAHEVGN
jgi:hypothetical protein